MEASPAPRHVVIHPLAPILGHVLSLPLGSEGAAPVGVPRQGSGRVVMADIARPVDGDELGLCRAER